MTSYLSRTDNSDVDAEAPTVDCETPLPAEPGTAGCPVDRRLDR